MAWSEWFAPLDEKRELFFTKVVQKRQRRDLAREVRRLLCFRRPMATKPRPNNKAVKLFREGCLAIEHVPPPDGAREASPVFVTEEVPPARLPELPPVPVEFAPPVDPLPQ